MMLMPRQDSTEILGLGEQPLNSPVLSIVAARRAAVLRGRLDPTAAMERDQFNTLRFESGIELVAVVGFVADHSARGSGDKMRLESAFDKGAFRRRRRCNVYGEWKNRAVCLSHDLRTFALLGGLSHVQLPFYATSNVPSIVHSDKSSWPRFADPRPALPTPPWAPQSRSIPGGVGGRSGTRETSPANRLMAHPSASPRKCRS